MSNINVCSMAKKCGLSRQRFHQLIQQGVFPSPLYDVQTRRPHYTEEMQAICLEVRGRNQGINGKPIMFYAPRRNANSVPPKRRRPKAVAKNNHAGLIAGLKALGLSTLTTNQVQSAVKKCFPQGTPNVDEGEVLKSVFLEIKRQELE